MSSRNKKLLTIICLGLVLIAWRGYVILTTQLPSPAAAAPDAVVVELIPEHAQAPVLVDDAGKKATWAAQEKIIKADWGRDPFANVYVSSTIQTEGATPPAAVAPQAPKIMFTGISKSGNQWLAVTKGRIVRMGDILESHFKVKSIRNDSIMLEADGWLFTYTIGQEEASVRQGGNAK